MSSKWIIAALTVCLVTSALNILMFVHQFYNPRRPVGVAGMSAKDWQNDRQFKKAVESIADSVVEGKEYLDQAEVESIIQNCVVRVGGKISC